MARDTKCEDHLGNQFNSKKERAERYGLKTCCVEARLNKLKWTLEKALTTPNNNEGYPDHLGNIFPTKAARARQYKLKVNCIDDRLNNKKWSLEKALTTPVYSQCKDHLGNTFKSEKERAERYGLTYHQVEVRLNKLKWTLEKSLTTPVGEIKGNQCEDHLGNIFNTQKERAERYGLSEFVVKDRLDNKKWSLEKALTTPVKPVVKYEDPISKEMYSIRALAAKYNMNPSTLQSNLRKNNIVRSLRISFQLRKDHDNFNKTKYNITVDKRAEKGGNVFECRIHNDDGSETFRLWDYDEIDVYCLEQYKKLHNIA